MYRKSNRSSADGGYPLGFGLPLTLLGGLGLAVVGCPGPAPQTSTGGSGGERSSSASRTVEVSSSTSPTSSTWSTWSSSSAQAACTMPLDCPASFTECAWPTCDGGTCGVTRAKKRAPCNDNGGKLCDGAGVCVACLATSDCSSTTASCAANVFTEPPTCTSGACVPGESKDCSATHLACNPQSGCVHCASDSDCGVLTTACMGKTCRSGLCELSIASPASVCAQAGGNTCDASAPCTAVKHVFVSSTTLSGGFGGTAAADSVCQARAKAANLEGKWMSWTSDSGSSPATRFTHASVPYVLIDGIVVARDWTELTRGVLVHGIDEDERGVATPQVEVWTATSTAGTYTANACVGWTSIAQSVSGDVGIAGAIDGNWTHAKSEACSAMQHVYCVQQ